MTEHTKNEDQWRQPNDPLTKTGSLAFASLPADTSLLDHSVRQIKCQMIGDQVFDLIRLGRQQPDYLETTLAALDVDCRATFLRQIAKRIEGAR